MRKEKNKKGGNNMKKLYELIFKKWNEKILRKKKRDFTKWIRKK